MTRCVLLLCLGSFLAISFAELQEVSDVKKSGKHYPNGVDSPDGSSDEIDAQGPLVNANSTETKIDRWLERRAVGEKRGKQRMWKVIRREVRDMKNLLPTLASNISWMDLDVKDMNRNFFSLVGDIRVIKSEIMIIKKLAHTIWQNMTSARKDHKQINKTLLWILNNVTIVINDVEKTVKHLMDMSTSYGTVTEKLENAVESISAEFGQIKITLEGDFDQIKNDMKELSEIVFNMSNVLTEIRDNVSRLSDQKNDGIPADVSEISAGIASQSLTINTISTSVEGMSANFLHASRRIEEIAMLMNTLRERIDIVGERMLTVNSNISQVREGVYSVDEKVSLLGSNIADIFRQLGDLGLNITAIGGYFGGLTNNIDSMHHNFARVDSRLGDVHNRIVTDVGTIMGDLDEMKIQLRDMRGVLVEKCDLACKSDDKNREDQTRPPISEVGIGPDGSSEQPRPDYPPATGPPARPSQPIYPGYPIPPEPTTQSYPVKPPAGYPPSPPDYGRPPPGYPPSPLDYGRPPPGYPPSPSDYGRPPSGYPPASLYPPQAGVEFPPYPVFPRPGQPQFPYPPSHGYPPTTQQPVTYPPTTVFPPYPNYPPSTPDYGRPPSGYPPPSLYPPQGGVEYPSYPSLPRPGQPQFPYPPSQGYPSTTQQPVTHPPTTVFPPYPNYPPAMPSDYHYPYPPTPPLPYPPTIVYPNYYPPLYPPPPFYPPNPSYPPIPDYTLPPPVPAGGPPHQPAKPPSPGSFGETAIPWTGLELPAGPHGPGLPIGCDEEFTGICACACPCACGCPNIGSGLLPNINSGYEKVPPSGRNDCQCICSCPCPLTLLSIGARPGSPSAMPRPGSPIEGACDRKLMDKLIREIHAIAHRTADIERIVKFEHKKTRDVMLGEVDTKLNQFGQDIRVILDANLNLVTDTHNISYTLHNMKKEMFDEIKRMTYMIEVVGTQITQAIFRLVYGEGPPDTDWGYEPAPEEPPQRPDGPASGFVPPSRPRPPPFDRPMHNQRPSVHMLGTRPGRPQGRPPVVGRPPTAPVWPGRPLSQPQPQSNVWEKLEYPQWPSYPSGLTLAGTNPMIGRQKSYNPSENVAGMQPNGTLPTNGTKEINQSSEVALRLLPDEISAKNSKAAKESSEKEKKKKEKNCIGTDGQSEALPRSPHLKKAKKIGDSINSIDSEVDRSREQDDDTYDAAMEPDELATDSGIDVSIQDEDKLRVIEEPMDPIAFHNILQKHIKNQWRKSVAPRSVHRAKRKRRPYGRSHGRTRNRYRVIPQSLFPPIPGFPFTPASMGMTAAIPHAALQNPLRIKPPRMPIIPPMSLIPDIFASLPHRINGLPYSASYNDGKGNSWNINVNRRSNNVEASESEKVLQKVTEERNEPQAEGAQLIDGEYQTEERQMTEDEPQDEPIVETRAQQHNEENTEDETEEWKDEHREAEVSEEEETDGFTGHQ